MRLEIQLHHDAKGVQVTSSAVLSELTKRRAIITESQEENPDSKQSKRRTAYERAARARSRAINIHVICFVFSSARAQNWRHNTAGRNARPRARYTLELRRLCNI